MPKFIIEQIAINPPKSDLAKELLEAIGLKPTVKDTVKAKGHIFGLEGENTAELAFSYQNSTTLEFETLLYSDGPNWLDDTLVERSGCVTHLGMHIDHSELKEWEDFFAARGIGVAQEVLTQSHTNEFLVKTGRKYHYVIFDTKEIIGVDLKFIIRLKGPNETE